MTVEKFIWDTDKQTVSWEYGGKSIQKTFVNAHFAFINTQGNFICVEAGNDYSQDQIYHLSFDGEPIFTFDKVNGKVSWLYQDQRVEIDCQNIVEAQLYSGQGVVIVMMEQNQNRKLQVFTLEGVLSLEKAPPQGYSFVNLSTSKNQPSVVCDGGKDLADVYGRSRWHFAINTQTGDMTKENLAY
ncbi:MAG TPA: hypothetical protein DDW50_05710 [Firmicutes bacterium]|jgi:hypothetical protein|nr:hypothetical protein [Bacillota bacterium]